MREPDAPAVYRGERTRSARTIAGSRKREGTPLKILVIGAAGMIGRKLMGRLAREGALGGRRIEAAHGVDVVAPAPLAAPFPIASGTASLPCALTSCGSAAAGAGSAADCRVRLRLTM